MRKSNNQEFIEKARRKHGQKYIYNKVDYKNCKTKVIITCPAHGDFEQIPTKHLSGHNCPTCSPKWEKYDTELFIKMARKKHGEQFDYSKSVYKTAQDKIEIICEKHGSFWQIPRSHFSAGHGCSKCSTKRVNDIQKGTKEKFIKRSKLIFNNQFLYDKVEYKTAKIKVILTCKDHGDFKITPDSHLNKKVGCAKCKSSLGENKIREYLNKITADFEEQKTFEECRDIRPLPFDFYLGNLLIEYQGEQHYFPIERFGGEKAFKKQLKRDKIKKDFCNKNGFQLLEIKFDDKNWKDKIEESLFKYLL